MLDYSISIHSVEGELLQLFNQFFVLIYRQYLPFSPRDHSMDMITYYLGWKLRGDEPYLYININDHIKMQADIRGADSAELLRSPEIDAIRLSNWQACYLYHHYHFMPEIKAQGSVIVEHKVSYNMIQAVSQVQKHMQRDIERRNISIECDPSSNYLISTFKRYDRHPLISFNDKGLFDKPDNPRMHVSINTDDQGVFDTCLENEYALIACALKKANEYVSDDKKIPHSRIYDWLDNIRKMGLEQSFVNTTYP